MNARHLALLPLVLILSLIAAVSPVSAQSTSETPTYYVSPDGDDGDSGSREQPWRTIGHSLLQLQAGDTLRVRGGTYHERVVPSRRLASGTPTARIRVVAHPGERPVVRGRLYLLDADHWTFEGLNVTADGGSYSAGDNLVKIMDGTGWTFRGGEIWGARDTSAAVFIGSNHAGEPADWRFVGNCVHDTQPREPETWKDHNIYVSNGDDGGPGVIERNLLFGAPNGENIKLGPPSHDVSGQGNVTVRHNTMHEAAQNVVVAFDAHHNTIERNLMGRGSPAPGKVWYPNVRGYRLTGKGNVARNNAGFEADQFLLVGKDDGRSTETIETSGNRFPVTPGFDATSTCEGLYPTNRSYRPYGAYAPVDPSIDPIHRIAGTGRVETSVEISKGSFPTTGSAENVVIARSDTYPDALAGGPLASALDAPILLTGSRELHRAASEEVRRLGADRAYLLGGEAALSKKVEADLERLGLSVRRIEGTDRFATAAQIGQELATLEGAQSSHAYVVEGADADPARGWPDAVATGFLAGQLGRPILLATTEVLPSTTRRALSDLGVKNVTLVGGPASISRAVEEAIDDAGPSVDRIAGATRFHTSQLVAEAARKAGADPSRVWFATGGSFPDALSVGPAVAMGGGVLLLVPGNSTSVNDEAGDWLDTHMGPEDPLRLIGGAFAISLGIEDKARYEVLFR